MATFLTSIVGFLMVWGFVIWVATSFFAAHVANTKNRCGVCWFFWGLLFGPFSLVAAAGMAPRVQEVAVVGTLSGGVATEGVPYAGESGHAFGKAMGQNFKKPGAPLAALVIVVALVGVYAASRLS